MGRGKVDERYDSSFLFVDINYYGIWDKVRYDIIVKVIGLSAYYLCSLLKSSGLRTFKTPQRLSRLSSPLLILHQYRRNPFFFFFIEAHHTITTLVISIAETLNIKTFRILVSQHLTRDSHTTSHVYLLGFPWTSRAILRLRELILSHKICRLRSF